MGEFLREFFGMQIGRTAPPPRRSRGRRQNFLRSKVLRLIRIIPLFFIVPALVGCVTPLIEEECWTPLLNDTKTDRFVNVQSLFIQETPFGRTDWFDLEDRMKLEAWVRRSCTEQSTPEQRKCLFDIGWTCVEDLTPGEQKGEERFCVYNAEKIQRQRLTFSARQHLIHRMFVAVEPTPALSRFRYDVQPPAPLSITREQSDRLECVREYRRK